MRLEVIVAIGPDDRFAGECVDAVLRTTDPRRVRAVLVNDSAGPEITRYLHAVDAAREDVTVVGTPRRLGELRANNLAVGRTTGDVVVFLTPDSAVPPGWVERVVACFETDPSVGVAGAAANGIDSAEATFGPPDDGFFAVSRACLSGLDGFDPVFGSGGGERIDFAMRAAYEGFRTLAIDGLVVPRRQSPDFGPDLDDAVVQSNWNIVATRWGARLGAAGARGTE